MSDPSRQHHAAIIALLDPLTGPPTNYQLFLGKVTVVDSKLTYPYLCVWRAPGQREIQTLAGTLSDLTTITQINAVAEDEEAVLMALDRVAELLHGKRPSIAGRLPGLIRQVIPDPIVMPNSTINTPAGQPTYEGVLQFQLNSTAAPAA